jgi:hypothetical protein
MLLQLAIDVVLITWKFAASKLTMCIDLEAQSSYFFLY